MNRDLVPLVEAAAALLIMPLPNATPTDPPHRPEITELLSRFGAGDATATDDLFPLVYQELRSMAARFLQDESRAHTMQATALVHEAYLRMLGPENHAWEGRAHFFGAAAKAIRRILIDHARTRARLKRGGTFKRAPLTEALAVTAEPEVDLVGLDEVLQRLARIDPQKARVVELRFFGGLSVEQTAEVLGVSPSTVARDWQFARVWLARELETGD